MHYRSHSDFFPKIFLSLGTCSTSKTVCLWDKKPGSYNWNLGTSIFVSRNLGERETDNGSEGLAARFNFLEKITDSA